MHTIPGLVKALVGREMYHSMTLFKHDNLMIPGAIDDMKSMLRDYFCVQEDG